MKYIFVMLIFFTYSVYAKTSYHLSTKYYIVKGDNISEIIDSIKVMGPQSKGKKVWALIHWDINTVYHFVSKDNGCKLIASEIEVQAVVRLPYWEEQKKSSLKSKRWWPLFFQFLHNHEILHFENVKREVENSFSKKIESLGFHPSCTEARDSYLDIKHESLRIINDNDLKIDRESIRLFKENNVLNVFNRGEGGISIESGLMSSSIGINIGID